MAVLPPDHHLDHLVVGLGAGEVGRDVAPVAEDRALVGKLGDLVHAMRNVEQGQPLGPEPLQHREDPGHIGGGERRGGFVEDEDAGLARQCLGDLDDLAARQGQVLDRRHGMDVLAAGAGQRLLGDPALGAPVDQAEALGRIADDDVVGNGKIGDEG